MMDESTTVNEFFDEYRKTHGGRKPSIADAFIAGRESLREFYGAGEFDDLRRQLETAELQRDALRALLKDERQRSAIAKNEAADLRQQLATTQAGLAAARIAMQAYAALAAICPTCGGSGEVDSGGGAPWGAGIDVTCPTCNGSGKAYNDSPATGEGE